MTTQNTPARAAPVLRVTPRDLDVLDALADYRFLSVPQLTSLFFQSAASATSRLKRLVDARLATKVYLPVRPYDPSSQTIYALAAKGSHLLQPRHQGRRPRYLTERERRSGLFLDHTLRRNDLRICLELLARQAVLQLLTWRQAPEDVGGAETIRVTGRRRERVPFVPDGYFAVLHRGVCTQFVVEIDMGTVRRQRMWLRYRAYWAWWNRLGYYKRFGPMPLRVLTVTTTKARLDALKAEAEKAPERTTRGRKIFWFALLEDVDLARPERLLGPVWSVAGKSGSTFTLHEI